MNILIMGGLLVLGVLALSGAIGLGIQEEAETARKAKAVPAVQISIEDQISDIKGLATPTQRNEQIQELLEEMRALRQQTGEFKARLQALTEHLTNDAEPQSNLLLMENFTHRDDNTENDSEEQPIIAQ